MPTLTPASPGSLTFTPVTGVDYDGFYPSASTYPSSTLYPGILSVGAATLSLSASPSTSLILTPA